MKRRRVLEIRNEEDRYAIAASYKEEEADEEQRQSEEAEHEAQRIEQEIEQLSNHEDTGGSGACGEEVGTRGRETYSW